MTEPKDLTEPKRRVQEGTLIDGSTTEWPITCPRCGRFRGDLTHVAHDFIDDCPECRSPGFTGPTGPGAGGPTGPPMNTNGSTGPGFWRDRQQDPRDFERFLRHRSRRRRS